MAAVLRETVPALAQKRVFNHDIMGCTADGVTGNHLYSGRALGSTLPGDVIQLHRDLMPQWDSISRHYDRVGLDYTHDVVWHVQPRGLAEYPAHDISVFFFGSSEQRTRADDAWYRTVDYINSKNNFMALAEQLDVAVPQTRCFEGVDAITDAHVEATHYPCYLKAAVSVAGVGIYRCEDVGELRSAMSKFSPGVPIQIQQEVVSDTFLNIQYEVSSGGLKRLAITEQVLDGFAHQGNRYPASHEPWESVEPMAEWLYQQGMRGVFAFDVAVVQDAGKVEYVAIECNPRFNGASYPTAIAHKLGIKHWLARSFQTRHRSLDDLDLGGLEYDAQRRHGVILVNWGPILVGKLLVLLAGEPPVQEHLALELQRRL